MLQVITSIFRSVFQEPSHVASSSRPLPSCTKTPAENFKTMRLLSYTHVVDVEGRWWKVETRQCPYTGIILRQTKRITE